MSKFSQRCNCRKVALLAAAFTGLRLMGGIAGAEPNLTLPFQPGTVVLCTQGAFGTFDHDNIPSMQYDLDFAGPAGTDLGGTAVVAAAAGVAYAFDNTNNGMHVKIDHQDGSFTVYLHLTDFAAGLAANGPGISVHQGDIIGHVGSTGRSTGPHLHFGLHTGNPTVIGPSTSIPITQLSVQKVATGQTATLSSTDFECDDWGGLGQTYRAITPTTQDVGRILFSNASDSAGSLYPVLFTDC